MNSLFSNGEYWKLNTKLNNWASNMNKSIKPTIATRISKLIENFLKPIILLLYQSGITANMITLFQLPFTFLMIYYFYIADIFMAIITLSITLFLDIFDGSFARITKTVTKRGHYLDKIIDLISISAFIVGLIFYIPEQTLLLISILILSLVIYILNEFTSIQVVGGVRSIGLIALMVNMINEGLIIILFLSIGGLIFKMILLLVKK